MSKTHTHHKVSSATAASVPRLVVRADTSHNYTVTNCNGTMFAAYSLAQAKATARGHSQMTAREAIITLDGEYVGKCHYSGQNLKCTFTKERPTDFPYSSVVFEVA
jgi:hypothetical protein